LTHDVDVATDTFKAVISAAFRQQGTNPRPGIDEVSHAEFSASFVWRVDIHPTTYWHPPSGTLNDIQTNATAETNVSTWPTLAVDRADARRHTAANVANLIEGSIFMDLCHCDFGQYCV